LHCRLGALPLWLGAVWPIRRKGVMTAKALISGKNLGVDVATRAIESKREQERVAAAGTPAPRPERSSHFLADAKASLSLITFTAKLRRNRNKF